MRKLTMVRAILIDPEARTLTEVHYPQPGGLTDIYRLTGCDCIDAARLPDGHAIYVDDEGLYKPDLATFWCKEYPSTLLKGRGLLVGPVDRDGDTTDCQHSLEWAKRHFFAIAEQDDGSLIPETMTAVSGVGQ